MRADYAYTSMMRFENAVNGYLSSHWHVFQDGRAILVTDKQLQYRGVDISCSNGLLIDSKIKNTCTINEIFDYPSVEITIKHNTLSGWFANPSILTHAYLFISVFATRDKYQDISPTDITKLDCMLFSKNQLKAYIQKFTPMELIYKDALMLDDCHDRKNYYDSNRHKVFHLKYSPYNEGAVNLVIHRSVYMELPSTRHFTL